MSATAPAIGLRFGQRSRVGFVLEGAIAVELEFGEDVIGRGCACAGLEVGVVVVGRHGGFPFVGSAAPIAAFVATKAAGGPDLHPSEAKGRSAAEDGGGRLFCFAMQSGRARAAAENSRPHAIAGPGRLPPDRPLRRPWARSSPAEREALTAAARCATSCRRASPSPAGYAAELHEAGDVLRGDLHAQRCPKRIDAEAAADPR